MAWETRTFNYVCDGCNEDAVYEGRKCPTWCADCKDARVKFGSLMRAPDRYPRKSCKGCGVHMSNFDYGNHSFCSECAEFERRRHNGWVDPYSASYRVMAYANDNSPKSKTCSTCECDLPLVAFDKHKKGGFGVFAECKECRAIMRSVRGREEEYAKRVRIAPTLSDEDIARKRKAKKISKIERWHARRRKEKRSMARAIGAYVSRFNKPWTRPGLSVNEKYRLRYANDNEFMLRERTRQRIRRKGFGFNALWRMRQSLNGEVGEVGVATIEAALGYSMSDLRVHLEALFTDGMSWDEFRSGRIHIDHKKPLSRFDLNDPVQAAEAWSLGNLQPLWAEDNMAKGAKTDEEWRAAA